MRTLVTSVLSGLVLAAALPLAGCYVDAEPAPGVVYYGRPAPPAYRPAPPPPQGYYHYYYRGSVVVR
jgi:hypothetical protein